MYNFEFMQIKTVILYAIKQSKGPRTEPYGTLTLAKKVYY